MTDGFTIQGRDTAGVPARQSAWYVTDLAIITAAMAGTGVLSGCAVTAQGTPDMTLAVAFGLIQPLAAVAAVAVTAGNVTISTADGTNPRIDLVTAAADGTPTVTAGTPASSPKPPPLPSGHVALCMVDVPVSDTTIQTAQITDKRFFVFSITTLPNSPNALFSECNSPAGTGGDTEVPWDTFYDKTQGVISGGTLTAALAAIGLTYSAGVFTATEAGNYHLHLAFGPVTAPALQGNEVRLHTSDFIADPQTQWGTGFPDENNPPPNSGGTDLQTAIYLGVGDSFYVRTTATGTVTDGVIDYAAMSIIKAGGGGGGGGGLAPNVIVGECNTPPTDIGGNTLEYDLWYDGASDDITAGFAAALLAIGLTYSAGYFEATEPGVWSVMASFSTLAAPVDQINHVRINTSMYQGDSEAAWDVGHPSLPYNLVIACMFFGETSDSFRLTYFTSGASPSDGAVVDYATITITRLQ